MADELADEMACVHVWVKGRVQNVGFRAHVESSAQALRLAGWVRNVGHDTVEAVAQGPKLKVEQFVREMQQGPRGSRVSESKVEWESPTPDLKYFEVRRSA